MREKLAFLQPTARIASPSRLNQLTHPAGKLRHAELLGDEVHAKLKVSVSPPPRFPRSRSPRLSANIFRKQEKWPGVGLGAANAGIRTHPGLPK